MSGRELRESCERGDLARVKEIFDHIEDDAKKKLSSKGWLP